MLRHPPWKPYIPYGYCATDDGPDPCPTCGHVNIEETLAPGTLEEICIECGTVLAAASFYGELAREPFNPPCVRPGPPANGSYLASPVRGSGSGSGSGSGGQGAQKLYTRVTKMSTASEEETVSLRNAREVLDRVCGIGGISQHVVDCANEVFADVLTLQGKGTRHSPWLAASLFFGCKLAGFPRSLGEVCGILEAAGVTVNYKQFTISVDAIPQLLHGKRYAAQLTSMVMPLDSLARTLDGTLQLTARDTCSIRRRLDCEAVTALQKSLVHQHQATSVLAAFVCWAAQKEGVADLGPGKVGPKLGVTAGTVKKVLAKCTLKLG